MTRVFVGLAFALALLAGAWLRFAQLRGQVPWGDELQSLRAAVRYDYAGILTHFGRADYCIPQALLNRLLLESGSILEWALRLPALVFGTSSVIAFAVLARREFGTPAALTFSWLLALSPFHVSMSRFARPYPISIFLAVTALFAIHRFHTGRDRRMAWVFAVCAILAPFFHLSVLAAVVAPPFLLALTWIGGKQKSHDRASLIKLGLGVSAGICVLLLPAIISDSYSVTGKALRGALELKTFVDAALLLLGTPAFGLLAVALLGLAILGAWSRFGQSRLPALLLSTALVQFLFTLIANPVGMEVGLVLARFNLVALPILLLFVSLGICRIGEFVSTRTRVPPWVASTGLCVVLLVAQASPISSAYQKANGWIAWDLWRLLIWPDPAPEHPRFLKSSHVPEFYQVLAGFPPGTVPIVEAPWYRAGPLPHSQRQRTHGQPVLLGLPGPFPPGRLLEPLEAAPDGPVQYAEIGELLASFGTFVDLSDGQALRARGVRYVILHRNLEAELEPGHDPTEQVAMGPWIKLYRERYGEPVYQDGEIVVFGIGSPHV